MVSLSYFDEHLAWQQRVQKETTIAHRSTPRNTELNPKIMYRYKTVDSTSRASQRTNEKCSEMGDLNVYAEVRGKYSRPALNMESLILPQIKSRGSTSIASRAQTGSSIASSMNKETEGKTMEELQKMLRQERLRRLRAERELKKKLQLESIN